MSTASNGFRINTVPGFFKRNQWAVARLPARDPQRDGPAQCRLFIYEEGGRRGRICLAGEKAVWGADGKKQVQSLRLFERTVYPASSGRTL